MRSHLGFYSLIIPSWLNGNSVAEVTGCSKALKTVTLMQEVAVFVLETFSCPLDTRILQAIEARPSLCAQAGHGYALECEIVQLIPSDITKSPVSDDTDATEEGGNATSNVTILPRTS